MPKQIYKIVQFHGGLNNNSDPRDIADSELSAATDIMVDELGKIRLMGGTAAQGAAARTNAITPGYGLFQFSHDRIDGHTAGSGVETGADYLVFSDSDTTGVVSIYSGEDTTWGNPITGLTDNTSGTGQRKDVFYSVDGALRVCDAEFRNDNNVKWYGYIKRTHFEGLTPGGAADDYNSWVSKDQSIAAPTRGLYFGHTELVLTGLDGAGGSDVDTFICTEATAFDGMSTELNRGDYIAVNTTGTGDGKARIITSRASDSTIETDTLGSGDYVSDIVIIAPSAGKGFNIYLAETGTSTLGSGWTVGDYEVGTTFIYDNNQESLVFENAGSDNSSIAASERILAIGVCATSPYDPRITGGRVYIRIYGTTDPWQFVAEISLKYGVKTSIDGSWDPWVIAGTGNAHDLTSTGSGAAASNAYLMNVNPKYGFSNSLLFSPNVETYESLNGFPQDLATLDARYKTAVVANRKTYIGNVKTTNEDGEEVVLGDAMLKSPVNKFDTFPITRIIEASIRDGDEIIKLEEYADRILQFKKNKMHLINISQEVEFLEDTFLHKGVSHPAATCKTDFGIAWVNKLGCYLYDGQKVTNLLEKEGRQIIKESEWDTFTTNEPMIGYIPKKRQLLIVDDNSITGTGKTFLYDLVTRSWVKGADTTITSQALTNFVVDWNGDLAYVHTSNTGTVVKWDDASDIQASGHVQIYTKDIDFGQPGQKKTVYKVYITYKSNGATNIRVQYDDDGGDFSSPKNFSSSSVLFDSNLELEDTSGEWGVAELVPDTPSQSSNIKSFRLRFWNNGNTPADFEINDISIVYRLKGVR